MYPSHSLSAFLSLNSCFALHFYLVYFVLLLTLSLCTPIIILSPSFSEVNTTGFTLHLNFWISGLGHPVMQPRRHVPGHIYAKISEKNKKKKKELKDESIALHNAFSIKKYFTGCSELQVKCLLGSPSEFYAFHYHEQFLTSFFLILCTLLFICRNVGCQNPMFIFTEYRVLPYSLK